MRAVIQRVKRASVSVGGTCVSSIERGFLVLLGVGEGDTLKEASYIAKKIAKMRVFRDENDKMNLDIGAVGGGVLLVSQFTLYGDARHGNRPSFIEAMAPDAANELYLATAKMIGEYGVPVSLGVFGADMQIDMCGDGPVTILLDTEKSK